MNSKIEDAGPCTKKVSVTVSADAVKKEVERAWGELKNTVSIPGFRKGKAPRQLLEKHQVIPLRSDDPNTLVLAMSDPNNIGAIEEIQFLVRRMVEPAVAPKASIRKALNQLDDFLAAGHPKPAAHASPAGGDTVRPLMALPIDKLLRAYILCQIDRGALSADELLARAEKL